MSANREVHVGTAPKEFEDWTSTNVYFHGFANLTTTRGEGVESPEFSCFGHQWTLILYPGGRANSDEGYAAIGLLNKSNTSIEIEYAFSVRDTRDAKGEVVYRQSTGPKEFAAMGAEGNGRCTPDFAERSTFVESLVNESLIIEVRMKSTATDKSITQFIPTNPINKNILQKFMDEESADLIFEVDNNNNGSNHSEEHTNKKSKTTTTFYAHRFILKDISTMLAELCKSDEGSGDVTAVSITDVKPDIFKHMIYYAYGGKLSEEELKINAKDIIDACDKYGVVHLKLEAEAKYVESTEITMDNMMDNLLYADSKNLALLKEAVMDYIVSNKDDIIGKISFDDVPGGTVTDVLTAVSRGEQRGEGDSKDYNKMRVGTLRKLLDRKGLDVDGSREAMIALLKEESS